MLFVIVAADDKLTPEAVATNPALLVPLPDIVIGTLTIELAVLKLSLPLEPVAVAPLITVKLEPEPPDIDPPKVIVLSALVPSNKFRLTLEAKITFPPSVLPVVLLGVNV